MLAQFVSKSCDEVDSEEWLCSLGAGLAAQIPLYTSSPEEKVQKTGLRVKGYSWDMRFDQNTMRDSGNVLRDTGFDQNTRRNSGNVLRVRDFTVTQEAGFAKLGHTRHDWEKTFSGKQ